MDGWMDGRALPCWDGCHGPRAPALPSLTVSWEHKKCTQAAGIGAFSLRISLGGKEGTPPLPPWPDLWKVCDAELGRAALWHAGTSRSGTWAISSWENILGESRKNLNSEQTIKTVVLQQIN